MKKQKSTLSGKLKSYSALAGSIVAVGGTADAQIIYTNITDYTATQNGDAYLLDLNNDSNDDFNLTLALNTFTSSTYYGGSSQITIRQVNAQQLASNRVGRVNTYSSSAGALYLNDNIGAANPWGGSYNSNVVMAIGINNYNLGPWVGATDRYLALRINVTGSTHYGWARLDVSPNSDAFTIKDYAYEKTPDKAILAGDKGTTTSVSLIPESGSMVYASGNTITVQLSSAAKADVIVANVLGEDVRTMKMDASQGTIDMEGSPSGIYFVTVNAKGKAGTTKVFIGK